MIKIRVECEHDVTLVHTVRDMYKLAVITHVPIVTNINKVEMVVHPDDSIEDVFAKYRVDRIIYEAAGAGAY